MRPNNFTCSRADVQPTRPSTIVLIVPDDNIPSIRLEDLAASHDRVISLSPETLTCEVLRSRRDLLPRVQLRPLVVVVAPPDGRAPLAADSSARSWARPVGRLACEVVEVIDTVEDDHVRGGGPPLGADVAVAAVAREVGHRIERVEGVWKGRSGFRRPILAQKVIVVGIDFGELAVDLLDRAVENDGGRSISRDGLDGPGEVNYAVLWVGSSRDGS